MCKWLSVTTNYNPHSFGAQNSCPVSPITLLHLCSDLPLSWTDPSLLKEILPPSPSPLTVSLSPLLANITIHKAYQSLYSIDSWADIKADGFSLNPLKTSDAEWLCSVFLKTYFNTPALMSECLPSVVNIDLVDLSTTGNQTLSNLNDKKLSIHFFGVFFA